MNNQKGNLYLIIAIIVGVFAIGAVGFASWKYFGGGSELEKETQPVYSPEKEKTIPQIEKQEEIIPSKKTDEISDWKSYRNEKYGFEVSYPKDWEIEIPQDPHFPSYHGINYQPGSEPFLVSWSKKGTESEKDIDFLIHTTKKPDNLFNKSFEDMCSEWLECGSSVSKVIIDGDKEAIKCIRPTGPASAHLIWLKRNNIDWVFMSSGIYDLEEPERQILPTFKFTETDEISDLETYKKDIFSLKYSSEIWSLKNNRLFHKEIGDSCMIAPGALWRQSLVEIVESINTTFNGYKARQVKLGTENKISTINVYFDEYLPSKEFSLSLPKDKQDKQTCENDFKKVISTIEFEK